jgi:hypothetical protein
MLEENFPLLAAAMADRGLLRHRQSSAANGRVSHDAGPK